jgi:hypothetical protein
MPSSLSSLFLLEHTTQARFNCFLFCLFFPESNVNPDWRVTRKQKGNEKKLKLLNSGKQIKFVRL